LHALRNLQPETLSESDIGTPQCGSTAATSRARVSKADFDRDTAWFSKGAQACEEFIVVDGPQNGFLFPNAAVPKQLLLSLCVDDHGAFFDCTEFGDKGAGKAGTVVSTGN
jgi:hypothetical protein